LEKLKNRAKNDIKIGRECATKKEKICAVVVTYNRKELLLKCLESLMKQTRPLDAIYIIDNASTDGTPEVLLGHKYISKLPPTDLTGAWDTSLSRANLPISKIDSRLSITIYYLRMNENTGGSGGFHEGVKRGYEKGYDWLWLMDDDALPAFNSLKTLLLAKKKLVDKDNFSVLQNQIVIEQKKDDKTDKVDLEPVNHAIFVGFFISKELIKKIGLPKKSFFIYYDDAEYCLRIRRFGGRIFKVLGSIIYHKDWKNQRKIKKRILNKDLTIPELPKWKFYYLSRNNILMKSNSHKEKIKAVLFCSKLWIKAAIIQPKFLGMITLGIIHGILGISGKRI